MDSRRPPGLTALSLACLPDGETFSASERYDIEACGADVLDHEPETTDLGVAFRAVMSAPRKPALRS
jgi:hypothetical protein